MRSFFSVQATPLKDHLSNKMEDCITIQRVNIFTVLFLIDILLIGMFIIDVKSLVQSHRRVKIDQPVPPGYLIGVAWFTMGHCRIAVLHSVKSTMFVAGLDKQKKKISVKL